MNNKIYILNEPDKEVGINYFLDSKKGIMVDISKCINSISLEQARYLCDNITNFEIKDDNYYLFDNYYLNSGDMKKYLDEIWNELSNGIIKKKNYLCLKHYGEYNDRYKTYEKLLLEINLKNYRISGIPIEQYIDGAWNKDDRSMYVTNIMIPIELI